MLEKRTYCFDMDGVICQLNSEHYIHRRPIEETINLMSRLRDEGHMVIIHTGRHIDKLKDTKEWLGIHNVQYDHIQFGKPVADVYIDDKGLRFKGTWTKKELKYFQ